MKGIDVDILKAVFPSYDLGFVYDEDDGSVVGGSLRLHLRLGFFILKFTDVVIFKSTSYDVPRISIRFLFLNYTIAEFDIWDSEFKKYGLSYDLLEGGD